MEPKSFGQIAYEAYCESTDWKSLISGATLPHWDELKTEIRASWTIAANAVVLSYQNTYPH